MKVKEIMATEVQPLDRNDTLLVAQDLMTMKRIRHLPVLEGGKVVGVVSQRDLFRAGLASTMGFGKKAQEAYLKSVFVKEAMTGEVFTIGPDADVREAARVMFERKIGCLPVVEDGKLVGLVSESDLVRIVADGKVSR